MLDFRKIFKNGFLCDACNTIIMPNEQDIFSFNDIEFSCDCYYQSSISSHKYDFDISVIRNVIKDDIHYNFHLYLHNVNDMNYADLKSNIFVYKIQNDFNGSFFKQFYYQFDAFQYSMADEVKKVNKLLKLMIIE